MDFIFYLMLLCFVLWYLRHMNNKYQACKFVYRMSELRRRLMVLADTGVIAEDNLYYHFDGMFKMLVEQHKRLNLYTISYLYFLYKSDKMARRDEQVLKNYCESHPDLQALYHDYRSTIYQYLKGQHKIIHAAFSSVSIFVRTSSNMFKVLNTILILATKKSQRHRAS